MPVDSDSLGSYLRQERERQRVSLQDIAAATKIQLKFLEALENDAYDQLPATPFVVGFLRAYAQYMAMDSERILATYRSLHRAPEPPEVEQRPVAAPTLTRMLRVRPQRASLMRLGLFLVVFGLLTGVAVYELRRGQQARSPVASFPAVLPALPEAPTPGSAPPAAPSVAPTEPASTGPKDTPPLPAAAPQGEPGAALAALKTAGPPGLTGSRCGRHLAAGRN
jgi:cytoskeleton protein RodZ